MLAKTRFSNFTQRNIEEYIPDSGADLGLVFLEVDILKDHVFPVADEIFVIIVA